MRRIILFVLVGLVLATQLSAQQVSIGRWKNYTDMKSVRNVVQVGNSIWAATGGGVFAFDTLTGQFTKYTNTDGLDTNDLNAITFENARRIWVGGAGGWVDVLDLTTHQWSSVRGIYAASHQYKGIQNFYLKGDTIFIVSQFGISVFIISRWEFADTYANFGSFSSPLVTSMVVHNGSVWVGTNQGVATAPLTAYNNLSAPDPWVTYTSFYGMTSESVSTMAVFNDTLVVGTDQGLGYFDVDSIKFRGVGSFAGKNICDLQVKDGKLLILWNTSSSFTIESLSSVVGTSHIIVSNSDIQGTHIVPLSSPWITTAAKGLARQSASGWTYKYPNGPNGNHFSSLALDDNGVLWCASGSLVTEGFYRFNPSLPDSIQWKNFTNEPFYRASRGANGTVWISSWGNGIVQMKGDSILRRLNHYSVPSLPGAKSDPKDTAFVVASAVSVDNEGRSWISCRNESSGHSLVRLNSDSTYTFFDNQYSPSVGWFHSMVIDRNDTKWLAGDLPWEAEGHGLYFFNGSLTISGVQTYNGWGYLSSIDESQRRVVLSLVIDLDGSLWIGTDLGVVIISDPSNPTQYTTSFPLREQCIQTIAVDALNNKWIGTREGVFVINSDGTQLLQSYTVVSTNRQLVSNDILTITIDQKRGVVYFGSENGLSSLGVEPVQTEQSYSNLEFGPNPFIIPNDQRLTIRNLVANSVIKIITVSGSVVAQFSAQGGGRAFWDGRDRNGRLISSGVYFVIAYTEDGSQVVTGKIAVIRK